MDLPLSKESLTKTTRQVPKSTTPDEEINPNMNTSHSASTSSPNQAMNCTLKTTSCHSPVKVKEFKSALLRIIPQEIRDMIYSYLLVSPVLGLAASVSSETNYGSTQQYNLDIAILYVCKQTYQEGMPILYENPIFIDCSNSPGDWDFTDGVYDDGCLEDEEDQQNGITEPYIINLCPLTRYTNCQPKNHQDKPLFRNTPNIENVKTWNILLNSFDHNDLGLCRKPLSSNAFAEFCVSVYSYPNISLNISVLPIDFHKMQTRTEAGPFQLDEDLFNNLLPLKILRSIKGLRFKSAELPEIPDYCCSKEPNMQRFLEGLSTSELPSPPELITEYVELTSGSTPVVECIGLIGDRLKEYFWLFHRAEFVVIEREFAGRRRSIRVHDISIRPPERINGGGLVIQKDEGRFDDCAEIVLGVGKDYYLEHTETAEEVLRFKRYRAELLKVLEPDYQNVRACSIKFREFLQSESGPAGIFVVGPSRATDQLGYWTRVTRAMEILDEYEYSFARGKTEELQLSLRERNKYFVLSYDSFESGMVMKKIAWAYERRAWKKLIIYYKIAIRRMEKHYFKLRWCRADLFKWDVLDRGSDLDTHFDVLEAIIWPKREDNGELDQKYFLEPLQGETSDEELEDTISFCRTGDNVDVDDDDADEDDDAR
ncbi:hypothetical protein ACHAPF_003257 [Botrytis cinerea]|uniref:F-box domain-containing protein n=1 Tax=Botryotinia fuckeliana (strain T4) TaxID=999810 RepID=G2YRK2_BOTF4|nr:hypothetical protein BofuT4_P129500.1 [Botrytis cinerea T4]